MLNNQESKKVKLGNKACVLETDLKSIMSVYKYARLKY